MKGKEGNAPDDVKREGYAPDHVQRVGTAPDQVQKEGNAPDQVQRGGLKLIDEMVLVIKVKWQLLASICGYEMDVKIR